MFFVLRRERVGLSDCVFAPDLPVETFGRKLSTSLISEHLSRSSLCFLLGLVKAGRSIGIVPLVDPCAIGAAIYSAVV